jgi:hypothetical protein
VSHISRETDHVVASLQDETGNEWRSVEWELQDGGEFLLVTVELAARPLDRNAPHRMAAYTVLSHLIPAKENGDYSWMVVFKYAEEVCDSVTTGVY